MTPDEIEPPRPVHEPAPAVQDAPQPAPTESDAVRAESAPPGELPTRSALAASTGAVGETGLIAPDVQQLAMQLAEEFFRPWELALREQFDAEIAQRLEF